MLFIKCFKIYTIFDFNSSKIQLWKPWMYSASLYQDWLTRLTSTVQLEPAQFLNFSANSQDPRPANENPLTDQVI